MDLQKLAILGICFITALPSPAAFAGEPPSFALPASVPVANAEVLEQVAASMLSPKSPIVAELQRTVCVEALEPHYATKFDEEFARIKRASSFFRRTILKHYEPSIRAKVLAHLMSGPSMARQMEILVAVHAAVRDVDRKVRKTTGNVKIVAIMVGLISLVAVGSAALPTRILVPLWTVLTGLGVEIVGFPILGRFRAVVKRWAVYQTELPPEGTTMGTHFPEQADAALEPAAMKADAVYSDLQLKGGDRLGSFGGLLEGTLGSVLTAMQDPSPERAWALTVDELAFFLIQKRRRYREIAYTSSTALTIVAFKFLNRAQLDPAIIPLVLKRVEEALPKVHPGAVYSSASKQEDEVILRTWFLEEDPEIQVGAS